MTIVVHRRPAEAVRGAAQSAAKCSCTEHARSVPAQESSTETKSTPRSATQSSWNGIDPATSAAARTSPACTLPSMTAEGGAAVASSTSVRPFGFSPTNRAKTRKGSTMVSASPRMPPNTPPRISPRGGISGMPPGTPAGVAAAAAAIAADIFSTAGIAIAAATSWPKSSSTSPPATTFERVSWRSSLTR